MNTIPTLILVGVTCIGCASKQITYIDPFPTQKSESGTAIMGTPIRVGGIAIITEGMTATQVRGILGAPNSTSGQGSVVYWDYQIEGRYYLIILVKERVVFIGEHKRNEQGLFPL